MNNIACGTNVTRQRIALRNSQFHQGAAITAIFHRDGLDSIIYAAAYSTLRDIFCGQTGNCAIPELVFDMFESPIGVEEVIYQGGGNNSDELVNLGLHVRKE